ncbi:MAG: hypothetical protein ACK5VI_09450 [Opitutia bacterium]
MNLIPAFSRPAVDALGASLREAMALGALRIWQHMDHRDMPGDFTVTIKFRVGRSEIEANGRNAELLDALDEAIRAARALMGAKP